MNPPGTTSILVTPKEFTLCMLDILYKMCSILCYLPLIYMYLNDVSAFSLFMFHYLLRLHVTCFNLIFGIWDFGGGKWYGKKWHMTTIDIILILDKAIWAKNPCWFVIKIVIHRRKLLFRVTKAYITNICFPLRLK